jgi:hypothetical protein
MKLKMNSNDGAAISSPRDLTELREDCLQRKPSGRHWEITNLKRSVQRRELASSPANIRTETILNVDGYE